MDDEPPEPPADKVVRMWGEICSTGMWSTGGYPIWPTDLPISAELRERVERWAQWYDDENLPDSSDPWEAHGGPIDAFNEEGRALARALKEELGPEWTVKVSDVDAWRHPKEDEHRCLVLPSTSWPIESDD